MKNTLYKTTPQDSRSGMVLLTVMLFSAVLIVLATGFYFVSGSQVAGVRRQVRLEKAFFIAEAGIERAKAELRQMGAWESIPAEGILSGDSVSFGGGEYSVRAIGNPDNTITIWSTGTLHNAKRVLEVRVDLAYDNYPPRSADGAVGVYGTNVSISMTGSSQIDGRDYAVPEGTVINTNAPTAGVFLGDPSFDYPERSGDALIIGEPEPVVSTENEGMHSLEYWTDLVEYWIDNACTVLEDEKITESTRLGTREEPEITVLSGKTRITANVEGAGILIITGEAGQAGEVEFETDDDGLFLAGNLHFEGLVILHSPKSSLTDRGAASLFGSVVTLGAGALIDTRGSSQICYSSQALENLANLPLPPPELSVVYWRHHK